jgi:transmembrane sensor
MGAKSNSVIEFLLKKYLYGKSTIAEKRQLCDLLASCENEKFFREVMEKQLYEFDEKQSDNKIVDFERIYGNILFEIRQNDTLEIKKLKLTGKAKVKRIVLYLSGIAAIFIIAFSLGSHYSMSDKSISSEPVIVVNYNEIKSPFGSKSEIKLPDGTQVMLNAGSTLKYRSDFNLSNRELVLVGEAYFKVAKNINLPLNVSAGSINIKAIGTEFNVKAYDDEGIIETTLVEGKVKITQLGQNEDDNQYFDLNQNQKAIYIKESGSFTLKKIKDADSLTFKPAKTIYDNILISPGVDVNQVIAWTKGKLILRGENLGNLCIELQRKYDVNFIFKNKEIKKYRFSGVLLDETLEQILNVIKLTAPINYLVEGKTVLLSSDKEQINIYSKHLK